MNVTIIYDDIRDREFLNQTDLELPIFIDYIPSHAKEAYKIKSHWGAKKNPFVITEEGDIVKVYYSEIIGDNALIQFIKDINGRKN